VDPGFEVRHLGGVDGVSVALGALVAEEPPRFAAVEPRSQLADAPVRALYPPGAAGTGTTPDQTSVLGAVVELVTTGGGVDGDGADGAGIDDAGSVERLPISPSRQTYVNRSFQELIAEIGEVDRVYRVLDARVVMAMMQDQGDNLLDTVVIVDFHEPARADVALARIERLLRFVRVQNAAYVTASVAPAVEPVVELSESGKIFLVRRFHTDGQLADRSYQRSMIEAVRSAVAEDAIERSETRDIWITTSEISRTVAALRMESPVPTLTVSRRSVSSAPGRRLSRIVVGARRTGADRSLRPRPSCRGKPTTTGCS
jgi:hypothetical protein